MTACTLRQRYVGRRVRLLRTLSDRWGTHPRDTQGTITSARYDQLYDAVMFDVQYDPGTRHSTQHGVLRLDKEGDEFAFAEESRADA